MISIDYNRAATDLGKVREIEIDHRNQEK